MLQKYAPLEDEETLESIVKQDSSISSITQVDSSQQPHVYLISTTKTHLDGYTENGYTICPVALNAIAVFVPFSPSRQTNQNLPLALSGGLSLRELREIYLAEETPIWNDYTKNNLTETVRIQRYIPTDQNAIDVFFQKIPIPENIILNCELNEEQRICRNQEDIEVEEEEWPNYILKVDTRKTINILGDQKLVEGENENIVGISFGLISKVIGECGVYPLAIDQHQLLISVRNDKPIPPDMGSSFCYAKASYRIDQKLVRDQKYPFTFTLATMHDTNSQSKDERKAFEQIMKTREMQCLLQEAHLVPWRETDGVGCGV